MIDVLNPCSLEELGISLCHDWVIFSVDCINLSAIKIKGIPRLGYASFNVPLFSRDDLKIKHICISDIHVFHRKDNNAGTLDVIIREKYRFFPEREVNAKSGFRHDHPVKLLN